MNCKVVNCMYPEFVIFLSTAWDYPIPLEYPNSPKKKFQIFSKPGGDNSKY